MSHNFSDFFQNVCNKLNNERLVQKISTDFSKLSTDCERFEFIQNLGLEHKLRLPCFNLKVPQKDSALSIRLRNEGNDAFIKRKGTKALKLYTRSVLHAPSCAELSLAYGNRSAVLFSIGYFEDCEADINRAIQSNYPDDLMFKLMKRKGECLSKLKRRCEAKKSYEDSLAYLKAASSLTDNKRKEIENNISQLLSDCQICQENVGPHKVSPGICLPTLSGKKNDEVFCASNAVKIHFSEEFGRHVVATRNIIPGDVLAVEAPFASILLPEFYTSHCYHCLRRSWSLIPCEHCCNVMYCSEECRKNSWLRYHEKECSILYYILQLDIDLLSESKKLEILVGGLILRHLQNLPCNAHEVSELFVEKIKSSTEVTLEDNHKLSSSLVEIGAAAYALLSLINHSCDPNVVRHSSGNKAVLRAIRPIREGEQIMDNYGYHYAVHSLGIRQSNLKGQYFFDCNCIACLEKWPCYQDLNETDFEKKFQCPDCKIGPMSMVKHEVRQRNDMQDSVTEVKILYSCKKCEKSTDMASLKEELINSSKDFRTILSEVCNGKRVDMKKLTDHLLLLDGALVRPWKEYNDCQEALKHCYALEGNCFHV
ncbi:hypothetical protein J437_LFUL017126 [Ladona fulva]|uniref:Protein-lysine N-methyltransferase SMYD4 n=1 Tax=Ladona fulva TaxID=123851 RepID=A0A8K0P8B2_LADFU|nr:hypothetical protein J437_LFUL017126 [Ladona fulva]